jgi:RNA polymerase sigma factor (sigma-70 family)
VWRDTLGKTGELALIQRAAQGDPEAFRVIVLSYETKLVHYLTQMLSGDGDSARDIAQDTFITVFQNLPRWQPPTADPNVHQRVTSSPADTQLLAPWLYRIATNHALSLLRKQVVRRKVQTRSHDYLMNWGDDERREVLDLSPQPSFEDRSIARELLRTALSTLSEDDAACLVLHYVSGERYGEIAARLGVSSEAVRKRVNRALAALRRAYVMLDTEAR